MMATQMARRRPRHRIVPVPVGIHVNITYKEYRYYIIIYYYVKRAVAAITRHLPGRACAKFQCT